jgi:hypothetical protein
MNTKSQNIILIPILFIGFALAQNVQALNPPPDGGYPGGNTAEGQNALFGLTSGGYNTAVGWFSLKSDSTGNFNTAIGAGTLLVNIADNNTATGTAALLSNSTGIQNTANGAFALSSNTTGNSNTANGYLALNHNTEGIGNTANGIQTLLSNITGNANTAIGDSALANNTAGNLNTAVGADALLNSTTGSLNIALGLNAGEGVTDASNVIAIGTSGANVSNSCYIGNIAGQTVGAGGTTCYVDNDGKLGVFLSARRFKRDIADMGAASEELLALRPVTFHYKPELDKTGIPQFGLVAEEVAAVNPELVTHDARGEINTVRYEAVNAMLLNEFLKEHRKVEEQAREAKEQKVTIRQLQSTSAKQHMTITQLKKEFQLTVAQLTARVEEQDSKIQQVSAQLEAKKAAPQIAFSDQ